MTTLDAAWAEAEAALAADEWLEIEGPHDAPDQGKYTVRVLSLTEPSPRFSVLDRPAAALRAVALRHERTEP